MNFLGNFTGDMQKLINEIDRFLVSYPTRNNVCILEGSIRDIESLLFELKGHGVVGLFENFDVNTANRKDALTDMLYTFNIDRERFSDFKNGKLVSGRLPIVSYDPDKNILICNDKGIKIVPDSRQAYFLKFIFSKEANKPISWDELFEEVIGRIPDVKNLTRDKKSISDIVRALNLKVRPISPVIKLFEWRGKSIFRLF